MVFFSFPPLVSERRGYLVPCVVPLAHVSSRNSLIHSFLLVSFPFNSRFASLPSSAFHPGAIAATSVSMVGASSSTTSGGAVRRTGELAVVVFTVRAASSASLDTL